MSIDPMQRDVSCFRWAICQFFCVVTCLAICNPADADETLSIVKKLETGAVVEGPGVNSEGDIAFAVSSSSNSDENGIWLSQQGEPAERVARFESLPGFPTKATELVCECLAFNRRSEVAFVVRGVGDKISVRGLWFFDSERQLHTVYISKQAFGAEQTEEALWPFDCLIGISDQQPAAVWFRLSKPPSGLFCCFVKDKPLESLSGFRSLNAELNTRGDLLCGEQVIRFYQTSVEVASLIQPIGQAKTKPERFENLVMSDYGHLAFRSSPDIGIVTVDPTEGTRVVLNDQQAGRAIGVVHLDINRRGNVVSYPALFPNSISSLYFCSPSQVKTIVMEGMSAPETTAVFKRAKQNPRSGRDATFPSVTLNNSDQIAFAARLEGKDVSESNDLGVWVADAVSGEQRLLARTSDVVAVGSQNRTIKDLRLCGRNHISNARIRGLNDAGQVALGMTLDDGSVVIAAYQAFASKPESVRQTRVTDADQALREWLEAADGALARTTAANENSGWRNVTALADSMRREHKHLVSEIDRLTSVVRESDNRFAAAELKWCQTRQLELEVLWDELWLWPFNTEMQTDTFQNEVWARSYHAMMSKYGDIEHVRTKVSEKYAQIESLQHVVPPLAPIPEKELTLPKPGLRFDAGRFVSYPRGRNGLAMFSHPLGDTSAKILQQDPWHRELGPQDLQKGLLHLMKPYIERLVQLDWTAEGSLQWDKTAWQRNQGFNSSKQAVYQLLRDANVPESILLHPDARNRLQLGLFDVAADQSDLAQQMRRYLRQRCNVSIDNIAEYDSSDLTLHGFRIRDQGTVEIRSLGAAGRVVTIQELGDAIPTALTIHLQENGLMRIHFDSKDRTVMLNQHPDRRLRLYMSDQDGDVNRQADSLASLYRSEIDLVDQRLLPVLEQIGVRGPVRFGQHEFVQMVAAHLRKERVRAEFDNLIVQLQSDAFSARQAALARLDEGITEYWPFIPSTLESNLSFDATQSLQHLVTRIESTTQYAAADNLIRALGTLESKSQLLELRPAMPADVQTLIDQRLVQ
ncbi:MAG: hypothetical protein KDA87_03575 [Planctomycetales bacterium]|nr:hypothetical protein [Planctomycetales bacterium]